MKKYLGVSLAVTLALTVASAQETETNWSGEFRGGYQHTKISGDGKDDMFGASGAIKYESDSWNNLQFGTRVVGVIGEGKEVFGIPFFNADDKGYGLVDELYIKGSLGNSELTVGRQAIDLPFVDTDEGLGLVDNRFEAVVFANSDIEDTIITLAHVRSWSGVDSDDLGRFDRVNGSDGLHLVGVEYSGIENVELKAFGYTGKDLVDIGYLEASYEGELDSIGYTTTLQYAMQDFKGEGKSNTAGILVEVELQKIPFNFNLGYNNVFDDVAADNLFGGGPFVTSMEHYTVAELGGKGNVIKGGFGYELIDDLTLEVNYALFNRKNEVDANELDIALEYEFSDNLSATVVYSDIKDNLDSDMKNLRGQLAYRF